MLRIEKISCKFHPGRPVVARVFIYKLSISGTRGPRAILYHLCEECYSSKKGDYKERNNAENKHRMG